MTTRREFIAGAALTVGAIAIGGRGFGSLFVAGEPSLAPTESDPTSLIAQYGKVVRVSEDIKDSAIDREYILDYIDRAFYRDIESNPNILMPAGDAQYFEMPPGYDTWDPLSRDTIVGVKQAFYLKEPING